MTFAELAALAQQNDGKAVPMKVLTVERIAYGMEHNLPVHTIEDVANVKLPNTIYKWRADREKRRKAFVSQREARRRYNERQRLGIGNIHKPGYKAAANVAPAAPHVVPQALGELPADLRQSITNVKELMKKHRYLTLEMSVSDDRTIVNLEHQPERSTHQL